MLYKTENSKRIERKTEEEACFDETIQKKTAYKASAFIEEEENRGRPFKSSN
jgi:hypothetical protein